MKSHLLRLTIACIWCWATLIPFRAQGIPLWQFLAGGAGGSSGMTSPGTGNLLFWLNFEANGNDSSANGRNFTVNGTVTYDAGKVNNGVTFNASNDYASIGDSAWQSPGGDFTIAIWHKPIDATPAANSAIFSKWSTSSNRAILVNQATDGTTTAFISDTGSAADSTLTSSGTRTDGAWFSLILVFDSATSFTMYINGAQEAQDTSSIPVNVHGSNATMYVGQYNATYSLGMYDSVAMFDKAFTAEEIAWFHNGGSGRQFSDL